MEPETFSKAVKDGIDSSFVDDARSYAQDLNISSTQIRNVYSRIKSLQQRCLTHQAFQENYSDQDLLLLEPRLAYASERSGSQEQRSMEHLSKTLSAGIRTIESIEDSNTKFQAFQNFCEGFEAILAFHKAEGDS